MHSHKAPHTSLSPLTPNPPAPLPPTPPQAKIAECEAGAAKMRAQSKAGAKQLDKLRKDAAKQGAGRGE
jgi:hypothetical protein